VSHLDPGGLRGYRRFDLLAATPFRAAFAFFCFGLSFGVELAGIVSAFDASMSDNSYGDGCLHLVPVPDLNDVKDLVFR
jgi:hypothetical protein